jgi:asparagine synthase (glutamine-hydrolysing)
MGPTKAFSIGFDEGGYSEVEWARQVAEHLGVEHRVEMLEPEVSGLFDHLMEFMDDPIGDFSIFPTYLISRHARSEVTVVLSGDGGDELFGGYETYVAQERARLWQRIPAFIRGGMLEPLVRALRPRPQKKGWINKARRFVEGIDHPAALAHSRWRLFVGDAMRRELFTEDAYRTLGTTTGAHIEALFEAAGPRSEVDRGLYVDMRSYLTDNCLVKVDRMSMACSLEVRVPLLDHEVVELAFRLPDRLKVKGGATKPLLKRIAARRVPKECVYRPKEGFSMPMKHWLRGPLRSRMESLLDDRRLREEGIFRPATVDRLKREHLNGQENHSHILWSMMVFADWRERWRV